MKKQRRTGNKKGVDFGKKKLRIIDPSALIISCVTAGALIALATVSHAYGFDDRWYGDLLTSAICVVGFFALINIGYVLMEGITVQYGSVFLGVDENKKPISFSFGQLLNVSLLDAEGEPVDAEATRWKKATLRFDLKNGTACEYSVRFLTRRKYKAILDYFEIQE